MKQCKCWNTKDDKLRTMGFRISDACSMLEVVKETLTLCATYGLPLERLDGKRLKRTDPQIIQISFCPFCGKKHETKELQI